MEESGTKMFYYKGEDLKLPDYERLVCDNCGGGLMKVEHQDEINDKIEQFKKKVDDGE